MGKKTFKLEKYYKLFYTITFTWDFFFFGKIDFSFDDFWSNFLFLLGPICRFRTNYVILQENF